MMKQMISKALAGMLLLLWGSALPMLAQSSGDYDPQSPADPDDPSLLLKYELKVEANMDGAGTLTGQGTYKAGTNVTVKATTTTGYKFLYWTKDNQAESYKSASSFSYITEAKPTTLTANYEKLKTITAKSYSTGVAAPTVTGGQSGYFSKGTVATLTAKTHANYVFQGWQKGSEEGFCSTEQTYKYTVEDDDMVFTAVYLYDPLSPADPTEGESLVAYHVKVSLSDERAGMVAGNCQRKFGETVTISTSPIAGYEFLHWNKKTADGNVEEKFSTSQTFTYTVEKQDVEFIAVYVNIAERLEANGHTLTLVCEPAGNGTFSIPSGQKFLEEDIYSVTFQPGTAVVFDGWYINGEKKAETLGFSSYMPGEDVVLVAKCHYDPTSPDDPDNSLGYQEEVEGQGILGDVDGDGKVTMGDAITVMNVYLAQSEEEAPNMKYDIDSDGKITMGDAIYVLNLYLNAQ